MTVVELIAKLEEVKNTENKHSDVLIIGEGESVIGVSSTATNVLVLVAHKAKECPNDDH
jgi:hypothetical protein